MTSWLEDVKQHGNESIKTMLVANKSDMPDKRQVSTEEGEDFARKYGLLYIETSAKSGSNVDDAFMGLAQHVFKTLNLSRPISELSSF